MHENVRIGNIRLFYNSRGAFVYELIRPKYDRGGHLVTGGLCGNLWEMLWAALPWGYAKEVE